MTTETTSSPISALAFFRQIVVLVLLGAVFGVLQFNWPLVEQKTGIALGPALRDAVRIASGLLFWAAVARALALSLNYLFWDRWQEAHHHRYVPKLLKDITTVTVWAAIGIVALSMVLKVSVTGLITASGIVIAVIGFALRGMIADIFTGIALGVERPVETGDWIELDNGKIGRVVEMNWRATRLITNDEVMVVIPNSYLASTPFTNFHAPEKLWRDRFKITLGHDVPAHEAERILLSAVNQVPESIAVPRRADVLLHDYNENGVVWEVRYWVPEFSRMPTLRDQVMRNALRNLELSGVRIPRNRVEIISATHPMAGRDLAREDRGLLKSMQLLEGLADDELEQLREGLVPHVYPKNIPIVRQGDAGDSMFVVKEGCLEVRIRNEAGENVLVGTQVAGMFFGDASLLTGEPRSATVIPVVDSLVLEIRKEDMAVLIERRPEIVDYMSTVLAERQLRNDEKLQDSSQAEQEEHQATLTERLEASIARFFSLGH
ncbi:MAG: mechanosensitive ion channel family protein [Alphaproteobacteria bacterium]